ncbi:serine/threonine-protein kinase [Nocardioides sp. C4-1]|uniref:serine/threonine-protein kinase n=1 Tax=Nocardioides sp. C4-1 TaxID=3151851 RepID=UPI003263671B
MSAYPSPGESIGRFRVVSRLGEGGMGVVFEALEVTLDRTVALKVIAPAFADDPAFRERFAREARAMAALDSQHVVKVYAHGEEDGYLYIATQLIPDGDLGELLATTGPPSLGDALDLVAQVAGGLADAHAKGLVHRDIKPGNVLLRRHPSGHIQAYLADFGIARRVDADQTQLGSGVVGTPSYLAPELYRGVPASPSTDVYALGCLLWTTLVGRPPHDGVPPAEVIDGDDVRPAPEVHGTTPLALEVNRILSLALADDPAERADVVSVRDDLAAAARFSDDPAFASRAGTSAGTATFVPDQPTSERVPGARPAAPAPPPSPSVDDDAERAAPAARRFPWTAVAAAVVGLVVGVAATFAVVHDDDDEAPATESEGGDPRLTAAEQAFVDQDAAEILESMERDMAVLTSVRLRRVSTDPESVSYIGSDLVVTENGECEGIVSSNSGRAGFRRQAPLGLPNDRTTFITPDRDFLLDLRIYGKREQADLEQILARARGRWMIVGERLAGLGRSLCELERQLPLTVSPDAGINPDGASKGDVVDVDGRLAVVVNAAFQPSTGPDTDVTAAVAVAEPHHLLTLGFGDEVFSYSEFDVPISPDTFILDPVGFDELVRGRSDAR